mgnify:CR=1 FL=1
MGWLIFSHPIIIYVSYRRSFLSSLLPLSRHHDIARLDTPIVSGCRLELYIPVVLQILEAIAKDCRVVDIDIYPITARDEAVATLGIKPLYPAFHTI